MDLLSFTHLILFGYLFTVSGLQSVGTHTKTHNSRTRSSADVEVSAPRISLASLILKYSGFHHLEFGQLDSAITGTWFRRIECETSFVWSKDKER